MQPADVNQGIYSLVGKKSHRTFLLCSLLYLPSVGVGGGGLTSSSSDCSSCLDGICLISFRWFLALCLLRLTFNRFYWSSLFKFKPRLSVWVLDHDRIPKNTQEELKMRMRKKTDHGYHNILQIYEVKKSKTQFFIIPENSNSSLHYRKSEFGRTLENTS